MSFQRNPPHQGPQDRQLTWYSPPLPNHPLGKERSHVGFLSATTFPVLSSQLPCISGYREPKGLPSSLGTTDFLHPPPTPHLRIQIPTPNWTPWKGTMVRLKSPTRASIFKLLKGETPNTDVVWGVRWDTQRKVERFLWVGRWMKMVNKPWHISCSKLLILFRRHSWANTLYLGVLLTSPQGILGILSHGVSFIQDH